MQEPFILFPVPCANCSNCGILMLMLLTAPSSNAMFLLALMINNFIVIFFVCCVYIVVEFCLTSNISVLIVVNERM